MRVVFRCKVCRTKKEYEIADDDVQKLLNNSDLYVRLKCPVCDGIYRARQEEIKNAIAEYKNRHTEDMKELIRRYRASDHFYGRMFGGEYTTVYEKGKARIEKDKVIKIETSETEFDEDRDKIVFVWGWPGPDYNVYSIYDYGKTWAFTEEELD